MPNAKGSGMIFEILETFPVQYAVAYYNEQHPLFAEQKKLFVHLFHDYLLTNPVIHTLGERPKSVLKNISELKPLGYVD